MNRAPTITAIIPSFRRWDYLPATVAQLLDQTRVPDEIVIVDQTPGDEVPVRKLTELRQSSSARTPIVYARQTTPHVYEARNAGANLARSELLLYLDDDIEADPDLVRRHLENLRDPGIDAVVGRVITRGIDRTRLPDPPGSISPVEQAFTFGKFRDDVRLEGIAYCVAGNLCLRREALVSVGGWDEHILTYGDKDLGLRLFAAGRTIVYDPTARIVHLVAPRGGTRLSDPASPWPAWQRAASIQYVAVRHLRGRQRWRYGWQRAAQHTFLLKRNALRPWTWFGEFAGFLVGSAVAYARSRSEGPLSSLSLNSCSGWQTAGPSLPSANSSNNRERTHA
jgi:GT2 family glycosyltransferase